LLTRVPRIGVTVTKRVTYRGHRRDNDRDEKVADNKHVIYMTGRVKINTGNDGKQTADR
jgi:hypothetical protein